MITLDELMAQLHKPIDVECPPCGVLQLRPLLDEEREPLKELLNKDLSDRESAERIVQWLLVAPSLTVEDISAFDDEQLASVIRAWSTDDRALGLTLPKSETPFEGFKQKRIEWSERDPLKAMRDEMSKLPHSVLGAIKLPDVGAHLSQQISALAADSFKPMLNPLLPNVFSEIAQPKALLLNQYWVQDHYVDAAKAAAASLQGAMGLASAFQFGHLDQLAAAKDAVSSMLSVIGERPLAFDALGALQATLDGNRALLNTLAAPMPDLSSVALAVEAARSFLPDATVMSPLQDMARQLASVQQGWLSSELESIRVGADVLGRVSALAQQDWLLNWPSPEMREHWKELDEAKQTLDDHGFGYTIDLWRWAFLRTLVRPVNPKMQGGVITRRLTRATQDAEFKEYMAALIRDLEKLPYNSRVHLKPRSRWKAIEQALDAHSRRHYLSSMPTLLAQVDGVLTCLLVARGELWPAKDKWGKRIYRGKHQITGKEIDATSLRKRLDCTQIQNDPVLGALKELLGVRLDDRNDILHGDDTTYGTPKLSTQLVLVLAVLANELGEIAETHTRH